MVTLKPYKSGVLDTMPLGSGTSTLSNPFAAFTIHKLRDVMRLDWGEMHQFICNQHRRYYPVVCATHGELVRLPRHLLVLGHRHRQVEVGSEQRVHVTDSGQLSPRRVISKFCLHA